RDRGDDLRDTVDVARLVGVLERRLGLAARLVPVGGAAVEDALEFWLELGELTQQELAEQVVAPVPETLSVERDEEQVRTLDRIEVVRRPCAPEDGVAERAAHLPQH